MLKFGYINKRNFYKGDLVKKLIKCRGKQIVLQLTRTKFRKAHKGRIHGGSFKSNLMNYGAFALKAFQPDRVTKTN